MFKDNLVRLFFRYTLPSVASMLGISLYILADTYFIANGIGSQGLTALNIVLPVYSLIHGVGLLIGLGGATIFSIAKAAGTQDRKQIFTFSLTLLILPAVIFTVAGGFFAEELARLLGASDQVLALSSGYLRVLSMFSAMFLLNNLLIAFVRNDSAPGLAMIAMLAGTMVNIVLDYVFIFHFGWGMFGAALATGSAPIVGIAILCLHFIKGKNSFSVVKPKLQKSLFIQILQGGSSSFIIEVSTGVVILAFNFALLASVGDIGVAAYGIIANIALVCTAIFTGLGQGMQPIISSNYGAGHFERCKKTLFIGISTGLITGIIFYSVGLAFPYEISRIFNMADDHQLTLLTVTGIRIYFVGFMLAGVNILISSYFQAILDFNASMAISITRGLLAIILGLALLPLLLGAEGIWATVPFAEISTFVLAMTYALAHFNQPSLALQTG